MRKEQTTNENGVSDRRRRRRKGKTRNRWQREGLRTAPCILMEFSSSAMLSLIRKFATNFGDKSFLLSLPFSNIRQIISYLGVSCRCPLVCLPQIKCIIRRRYRNMPFHSALFYREGDLCPSLKVDRYHGRRNKLAKSSFKPLD